MRRTEDEQQALAARQFNRQDNPDRSVQVSLDLGDKPPEHDGIGVWTNGVDFRRRVQVQGSDDGQKWGMLLDNAWVADYRVESQTIDVHRAALHAQPLSIPAGPRRSRSQPARRQAGHSARLSVFHRVEVPGEYVTRPAILRPREAVRAYGAPGSAWIIDLGGDQVPVERLAFDVDDSDFSRPSSWSRSAGTGPALVIARGEWRRRQGDERKPLEIQLSNETTAHRLRPGGDGPRECPAHAYARPRYTAPARASGLRSQGPDGTPAAVHGQSAGRVAALRLRRQPAGRAPAVAARVEIGQRTANPVYRPEPKPWTERWPWLVYVVLGAASVALLAILAVLAREGHLASRRGRLRRRASVPLAYLW